MMKGGRVHIWGQYHAGGISNARTSDQKLNVDERSKLELHPSSQNDTNTCIYCKLTYKFGQYLFNDVVSPLLK